MFGFLWGYRTKRDAKTLALYAKDISVFTITPKEVVYPRSVADIVSVVKKTQQESKTGVRSSVTVRAGGTCMSGGPLNTGTIIDMTKHMRSISINKEAKTATVEMGAYFRDIEDEASKYGLMFAPYPSSRRICGIGGMIGNNASGEKSIRYGATGDNVLSMEVVLADGSVTTIKNKPIDTVFDERERSVMALALRHKEILAKAVGEVKKAASGYRLDKVCTDDAFNLVHLFAGAQGTLGIITKATLQLVPIPAHLSLIAISASKLDDIPVIVKEIYKHNPEAVETFDIHTWEKAKEHLSVHAQKAAQYLDEKAKLFILAEFSEQTKEATEKMADACFKKLKKAGYEVRTITSKEDIAAIWEVRRNSFLLMRDHNPSGFKAVPCIEDVIVPVDTLSVFIKELNAILIRRKISYGFHGHIGDGSLRIVPVFDTKNPEMFTEITELMKEVFALVKNLKGNMSADHSDGIIRSPFLRDFYGNELYDVFEQIKYIYDPYSIMNPGKKVGASLEGIRRHFDA